MKRYTLRTPDQQPILDAKGQKVFIEVDDDLTPEEVNEVAERRIAEVKIEAARDAVQRDVGRPAPPPPRSYGGAKDPLDDKIRCPVCAIGSEPVTRRDLMAHLKAHDAEADA